MVSIYGFDPETRDEGDGTCKHDAAVIYLAN